MSTTHTEPVRERRSHIWKRETHDFYVEPCWVSERLFEVESFKGAVQDPCCGWGRIPEAAKRARLTATGADLVDRGYADGTVKDFFASTQRHDNIVCNPPFSGDTTQRFAQHALTLARSKVAIISLVAKLNAAHWLRRTPLRRIWLLTPRPSMPPGHVIAAGEKPGGGKKDFCWLIFEVGYTGPWETKHLHRDE